MFVYNVMVTKPMRVLLISPRYHGGGAERAARELFNNLPDAGIQTHMYTAVPEADAPSNVRCVRSFAERLGYPLNWLPTVNDWRHWGSRAALSRITRENFDVVHLHNIHGDWISIRSMMELCKRVPCVWTLHDEWAASGGLACDLTRVMSATDLAAMPGMQTRRQPYSPNAYIRCLRRFLTNNLPRPQAIICPSEHMRRLVDNSGNFPDTTVRVVPNSVALLNCSERHMDRAAAREQMGLPVDKPAVIMVAANLASPHKGMDLAVDALRRLQGASMPSVLLLGRDGGFIKNALPDQNIVCKWIDSDEQLATAYRAVDVALIPSRADNFPYVALEALACETPIVGFSVGGLIEITGDNQHRCLIEPFDTVALADRLKALLGSESERKTLAHDGCSWVEENCDPGAFMKRIVSTYVEVSESLGAT